MEATNTPTERAQTGARIDELAPDFEARSTHGHIRLSDYTGKWLVFFSHPADFTPVCTSEFVSLQNAIDRFESLNCKLLGLSIDSLFSHIAWVKDLEQRFNVTITFPIVEDISMVIARAYGMIHDASMTTATVRSVFFIDPDRYIRAIIHYPMNVGRSVEEIIRVISALQESDANEVATPEGWLPGQEPLLPPPADLAEAGMRENQKGGAWYLTPVSKDL
ncbi:MAG: peroxiredoxin [Pseudomonadota bacterium]